MNNNNLPARLTDSEGQLNANECAPAFFVSSNRIEANLRRATVALLRQRGFALCKPDPKEKKPRYKGWSTQSLEEADFAEGDQLGILGGALSNGSKPGHSLIIVDLDDAQAVERADDYLPTTGMSDGRPGKPRAHRYYLVSNDSIPPWACSSADQAADACEAATGHPGPFLKHLTHRDTHKGVLDFIGTGGQVVCPPSTWTSKDGSLTERREWTGGSPGEPTVVPFLELWRAVCELASACGAEIPDVMPRPKPVASQRAPQSDDQVLKRARKYLEKMDASIAGQGGHRALFKAARFMVYGFDLSPEVAFRLLDEDFNPRCQPQWTAGELRHKIEDADRIPFDQPRGWLRDTDGSQQNGQSLPRIAPSLGDNTNGNFALKPVASLYRPLPEYRPFPVKHLPPALGEYVLSVSAAMRCDPAFIALPAMGACAGMIGTTRVIELKNSWREPALLWLALIAVSGSLKTPTFMRAIKPVLAMQGRLTKDHKDKMKQYETDLRHYERDKKKAADPGDPPTKPICTKIYAKDTTVEALAENLNNNPDRFLFARDELSGWISGFNQYKKGGSDLSSWLELHNLATLSVDRKSGEPKSIWVSGVGVSICGGIQPGVLRDLLSAQHFASGLSARLLFAYPPKKAKEWTDEDIPEAVEERYTHLIRNLAQLEPVTDAEGNRIPRILRMTPEAKDEWVEFYNQFAHVQSEQDGDLAAAFSKIEGYAARLSLLHHVCTEVDEQRFPNNPVPIESVRAGIALSKWFSYEAERVYAMLKETRPETRTRELFERVKRLADRHNGRVMARDLQRSGKRYRTADEASADLESLVGLNLGRWEDVPSTEKGGHPTRAFVLLTGADTTDTTSEAVPA